uniref:Uncharacterized protein n=1 Tax=Arundo donax TaxID=35708 RepID=A0A0A9HA99_ARUDO
MMTLLSILPMPSMGLLNQTKRSHTQVFKS